MTSRLMILILFSACGPDYVDIPGIPHELCEPYEFQYYVENSLGGTFDIAYIDYDGTYQVKKVFSGWKYSFNSNENYFYFLAYGDKQGNTFAQFSRCGVVLEHSRCWCSFPILEYEVFLED